MDSGTVPRPRDTGFDYSLLCDFRARLIEGDAADRMLRVVLKRLTKAGLLKSGGRQRTDATYVLSAVRCLSRMELAVNSLRAALEELSEIAPEWLRPQIAGPLRARDACEALDHELLPKNVEGVRAKLKRLVKLDILTEDGAGSFARKH